MIEDFLPSIFDMLELCMSGQAFKIFLRSSLAHTMNAFIGRLICGLFSPSLFCCLTILAEQREDVLDVNVARLPPVRSESDFVSITWRSRNKSVMSASWLVKRLLTFFRYVFRYLVTRLPPHCNFRISQHVIICNSNSEQIMRNHRSDPNATSFIEWVSLFTVYLSYRYK